jgi:hypothetical protein
MAHKTQTTAAPSHESRDVYFTSPLWGTVFLFAGGAILLVVGLSATIVLGVSASSDRVFAIEALIAGLSLDFVLRHFFDRQFKLSRLIPVPLLYIWPLLCGYVWLARPFE